MRGASTSPDSLGVIWPRAIRPIDSSCSPRLASWCVGITSPRRSVDIDVRTVRRVMNIGNSANAWLPSRSAPLPSSSILHSDTPKAIERTTPYHCHEYGLATESTIRCTIALTKFVFSSLLVRLLLDKIASYRAFHM